MLNIYPSIKVLFWLNSDFDLDVNISSVTWWLVAGSVFLANATDDGDRLEPKNECGWCQGCPRAD